ncbi:hypothetical protein MMMDOFMJ_4281 [Methylobacterium gnaphalii]|nr:hypothetical protein MMMDOFMJ_4281 [Methylobacterium gnaphalii]
MPPTMIRSGRGAARPLCASSAAGAAFPRAVPYRLGTRTTDVMEEDSVHGTMALPVSEPRTALEMADA